MSIEDLVGYVPFEYMSSDTDVDASDVTKSRFVGKTEEESHFQPDTQIASQVCHACLHFNLLIFALVDKSESQITSDR